MHRTELSQRIAIDFDCRQTEYALGSERCGWRTRLPKGGETRAGFSKSRCFVEVKPNYPNMVEMQKCEIMAHRYKDLCTNVVLVYGNMNPPYSYDQISDGILGMQWSWNQDKLVRSEVVLCKRDSCIEFSSIDSTLDQSWAHPLLTKCYNTARDFVF